MVIAVVLAAAMLVLPQGEHVPDSTVINDGRITRAIPEGGLENFDWSKHRAAHGPDSGTWQVRGGQLVVTWGDGGVHQGPITVHPDGIEFYGKRYSKPVPVDVTAITGSWESARGTAITGGAGINRVSELVIAADGRYRWVSTTGGVVEGRATASDRSMSGTVIVRGLTIVFKSNAGTTSSHTLLPAAGQPVNAFSVDSDMFTRSGPAPATVAKPTSTAAPPTASAPATESASAIRAGGKSFNGLSFTLPPGWTGNAQQGSVTLTPPNLEGDGVVSVTLIGAEPLSGTLDEWMRGAMSAAAGGMKVIQSGPPARAKSGALDVLSIGQVVQDSRGLSTLIYYAISDGRQVGLALVVGRSKEAIQAQLPGVREVLSSLTFGSGNPSAATEPRGRVVSGNTTITVSELVGHWDHGAASRFARGHRCLWRSRSGVTGIARLAGARRPSADRKCGGDTGVERHHHHQAGGQSQRGQGQSRLLQQHVGELAVAHSDNHCDEGHSHRGDQL